VHLFLDNKNFFDHLAFPSYPNPLVNCPTSLTFCAPPTGVSGNLTSDISAFAPNFQTPKVQQASFSIEREIADRFAVGVSYLYVHGQNLIRARDINLPTPQIVRYPVFDESGNTFLGTYYDVPTFSTWQFSQSLTCPFPPCINPLQRPDRALAAINEFESAASSIYNGLTVSVRRRMTEGMYFRVSYTWGTPLMTARTRWLSDAPRPCKTLSRLTLSVDQVSPTNGIGWLFPGLLNLASSIAITLSLPAS
jgi:hypothetical protein